jgi:DNA-binding CsgD family transcriptional regulator
MQAALARLTDNEKECLRRRLQQQTAKEMALELGVSPHAVEKRLKMARAKLGLSSSLAPARLLAESEGYQQMGPQASDLEMAAPIQDKRFHRRIALGATAMILIGLTALAVLMQPSEPGGAAGAETSVQADEIEWINATPETVRAFLTDSFAMMDDDKSGLIERSEVMGFGLIQGASPPDVE